MKKTLLTLALLVAPLTAQAQEKTNHFTPELIKETINRFGPIFCSEDADTIVNAVKDCYLNTPQKDQKRLQCYLADKRLFMVVVHSREKARQLGIDSANPYADIPFASGKSFLKREKALEATPGFEYLQNESDNRLNASTEIDFLMEKSSYCQKKSK